MRNFLVWICLILIVLYFVHPHCFQAFGIINNVQVVTLHILHIPFVQVYLKNEFPELLGYRVSACVILLDAAILLHLEAVHVPSQSCQYSLLPNFWITANEITEKQYNGVVLFSISFCKNELVQHFYFLLYELPVYILSPILLWVVGYFPFIRIIYILSKWAQSVICIISLITNF